MERTDKALIVLFLILTFLWLYDGVIRTQNKILCNDLSFFPPLEERESMIEAELESVYGHNIYVSCSGVFMNEKSNKFWGMDDDVVECRMFCQAHHPTEQYYIPFNMWFKFNYTDYIDWKGD